MVRVSGGFLDADSNFDIAMTGDSIRIGAKRNSSV